MAEEKNNQRAIDIMKAFFAGPRTYEQTNAMIGREHGKQRRSSDWSL